MINSGLYTSNKDDWSTPQWLFDKLNSVFHFTLDVCANQQNRKCSDWFGQHDGYFINGLTEEWSGQMCFMNPPYGREIGKWAEKAWLESCKDNTVVVGLLPARTDTKWFHKYIARENIVMGIIKGRVSFGSYNGDGYKESPAPFPSMIFLWRIPTMTVVSVGVDIYWETLLKKTYLDIPNVFWVRSIL